MGLIPGSTTNGVISFLWDLTDGQGNTFTNESFKTDFYTSANGSPMAIAGSMVCSKEDGWNSDQFVIARAEDFNYNHANAFDEYHTAVYEGAVNVLGNPFATDPYSLSPANVPWPFGDSSFHFTDVSKTNLLEYIADPGYRNFFWWGHGSDIGIGYSYFADGDVPTNKVGVLADEVRRLLGNGPTIRRHPYRLVFIHGCEAARTRR